MFITSLWYRLSIHIVFSGGFSGIPGRRQKGFVFSHRRLLQQRQPQTSGGVAQKIRRGNLHVWNQARCCSLFLLFQPFNSSLELNELVMSSKCMTFEPECAATPGNIAELCDMASPSRLEHTYILNSFQEFEALARRALHQGLSILPCYLSYLVPSHLLSISPTPSLPTSSFSLLPFSFHLFTIFYNISFFTSHHSILFFFLHFSTFSHGLTLIKTLFFLFSPPSYASKFPTLQRLHFLHFPFFYIFNFFSVKWLNS